jgi:hypothetical protein
LASVIRYKQGKWQKKSLVKPEALVHRTQKYMEEEQKI